jgi:hypothetical protein
MRNVFLMLIASSVLIACSMPSEWQRDTGANDAATHEEVADALDSIDAPSNDTLDVPAERPACAVSCGDFRCAHCSLGCCDQFIDGASFSDHPDVPMTDTGPTDTGPSGCACGVGACARTTAEACSADVCVPGFPTPELCNGIDDDCDGTVDNGVDLTSPMNCGRCGNVCMSAPAATPTCRSGSCQYICVSEWGDCDASRVNGCETNLSTDRMNCNGCGLACASGLRCVGGVCSP